MGRNRSEVQSMYLGSTGNIQSFNETEADFPYPDLIGNAYRVSNAWFQMVRFASTASGAYAAGRMAYWFAPDDYSVTNEPTLAIGAIAGGKGNPNAAGIIVGAPTAGNLGFIQKTGKSLVDVFSTTISNPGFPAYAVSVGLYAVTPGYSWISQIVGVAGAPIVAVWRTSSAAGTAVARADLLLRGSEL